MGGLVMLTGAALAFVAGAAYWPWYVLLGGAALWVGGYAMYKPHVIARENEKGGLATMLGSMFVMLAVACAVLFGLGRLVARGFS